MNNFEFEHNGKKLWYSRAVAVVGMIMAHDDNWHWYVLANKRGKNTPDFQGYWSLPCGYLDFNESCEEAMCRETFEETGLRIKEEELSLIGVDSIPDGRQNVTIRYICSLVDNVKDLTLTIENADFGEVDEVKWIPLDNFKEYKWAFNHIALISKHCRPPKSNINK
jgi:8-oxo-dGTP diphosphatase